MGDFDWFGLGSVVSGIAGAITGFDANKKNVEMARETNQTNMQIAQMNNEYNEKMLERQIAYNTEMWDKENQYNSPEAQAERMRKAGFNPYMSGVGNVAAGSVGSITTPTATPVTMNAPRVDAPDFSTLTSALGGMADRAITSSVAREQKRNIAEDANAKAIENRTRGVEAIARILNLFENAKSTEAKTAYQKVLNTFVHDMQDADLQRKMIDNENAQLQGKSLGLTIAAQTIELKALPMKLQLEMANAYSDLLTKFQNRQMTKYQMKHELLKMSQTYIATEKLKVEKQVLDRSVDALVEKAQMDARPTTWPQLVGLALDNPERIWKKMQELGKNAKGATSYIKDLLPW